MLPFPPLGHYPIRNVYRRSGPSRTFGGNRRPGKAFGGLVPPRPAMAAGRDLPGDYRPAGGPAEFPPHPPGIAADCRHLGGDRNGQELADQRPGGGRSGPHRSRPADNDPPGTALPPGADARNAWASMPTRSTWSSRIFPSLANLVLVDCPDPDTTDAPGPACPSDTTLARLRRILPLCDVLIVTTTQQKYRSARVAEELAAAAPGARLVFVQTARRPGRRCPR